MFSHEVQCYPDMLLDRFASFHNPQFSTRPKPHVPCSSSPVLAPQSSASAPSASTSSASSAEKVILMMHLDGLLVNVASAFIDAEASSVAHEMGAKDEQAVRHVLAVSDKLTFVLGDCGRGLLLKSQTADGTQPAAGDSFQTRLASRSEISRHTFSSWGTLANLVCSGLTCVYRLNKNS